MRAIFGKAPSAAELGQRLERLARRILRDAAVDVSAKKVVVKFHPHAPTGRISVLPDGDLECSIDTFALGRGYHAHVLAQLQPLLDELDFVWTTDDEPDFLAHLREVAPTVTRIGIPVHREYIVDAPVLTALGPRDAAWQRDPRPDLWPWDRSGPGTRERCDALLAMWHEIPWREPLDPEEIAAMERVDRLLRVAHDHQLDVPIAAWNELRGYLELEPIAGATDAAPIGYRRYDVISELDGWKLRLPGSFLGGWKDDVYVATDGERSLELATFAVDGEQLGGEHADDQLIEIAPPRFEVVARKPGRRLEISEHAVHGLVASAPHVAVLTCRGPRAWGELVFRSLTRA